MIDYQVQAAGKAYNTFSEPLSSNRIVLFLTSIWINATKLNELKIHIDPVVLNTTHYQWTATAYKQVELTRYQFSQIIFNEDDV